MTTKQGRIKWNFMKKVLSPIVDYSADYELLHFVYDLNNWTSIGVKKNIANQYGFGMRLAMKNSPMAPEYWRTRHLAVADTCSASAGTSTLFRTRAPHERSLPCHQWVMKDMETLGRERQHLAGPETFHRAHVLMQMDRAFMCGAQSNSTREDRTFGNHIFAAEAGSEQTETVQKHVSRLEFQDGKRKLSTQRYHGWGTEHSHSLDFLKNVGSIRLEDKMSAHLPDVEEDPLLPRAGSRRATGLQVIGLFGPT